MAKNAPRAHNGKKPCPHHVCVYVCKHKKWHKVYHGCHLGCCKCVPPSGIKNPEDGTILVRKCMLIKQ